MDFPFEVQDELGITYNFEAVEPETLNTKLLDGWIKKIIEQEDCTLLLLNFIFCSDKYLHSINLEYLNHDTYTDIITFPFKSPPEIEGDIFISLDRIKENATSYGISFQDELFRVIIHGVLHLCGYKDKTEAEQKIMRTKEDQALQFLQKK